MATFALIDARIEINSVVMSAYFKKVELPVEREELEDTAFGDVGRSRIAGLFDTTVGLTANQDMANGTLDSVIWALLGTTVAFKVRATTSAISTSNPEYVTNVLVSKWGPFGNTVGELATVDVSWPMSSPATGVVRNTT